MAKILKAFIVCALCVAAADSPIPAGEKAITYGAVGAGEGPVVDLKGNLYFSGAGKITKRDPAGTFSVFRDPAGSNGLIFDHHQRLVICESRNRRVTRLEPGGELTVLADQYESMKFNSPNDISIDSKGRIYFSDPRYGNRDNMEMRDKSGRLMEGVYRIDAPGKVARVLGAEVERANGVFVSPRDEYLYVADNNNNNVGGARKLWRFRLRSDGSVEPGSRKLIFDWQNGRGADGFKMDRQGRLYVAAGRNEASQYESVEKFKGGIYILSPEGTLLDFVAVPKDEVTNCAFGGADWKTLFVTAGGTLWSIRTNTPGWIPFAPK
jgi:gluconolactonase